MKTIVFFNNKEGIGKARLVYHFTYMLAELGYKNLVADLDPQANLSSIFLSNKKLQRIYENENSRSTILESIDPLNHNISDIRPVHIENINNNIGLIAGDLSLSLFEDKFSNSWNNCCNGDKNALITTTSFYRIINEANQRFSADFNIINIAPNFGAINRAILIAADYVIVPMAVDLFSIQGLKNLGNSLEAWRSKWNKIYSKNLEPALPLPSAKMKPLGYIVMKYGIQEEKPVKSYLEWANSVPQIFNTYVRREQISNNNISVESDENCIASLKHYYSLTPMAMEARKPIFLLKPADGAIGGHLGAVKTAYKEFKSLTKKVINLIDSDLANSPNNAQNS